MPKEFTFKLARGSEDGEDFQDVFADGEQIGKLVWFTGASAGWYFEDLNEQNQYICPLEGAGTNKYGDPVVLPLEEVLKLATEWLSKRRTKVVAKDIRKGQTVAFIAGARGFKVTFTKKLTGAYKGWIKVQYEQPEVPGGIAEQTLKLNEELELL